MTDERIACCELCGRSDLHLHTFQPYDQDDEAESRSRHPSQALKELE